MPGNIKIALQFMIFSNKTKFRDVTIHHKLQYFPPQILFLFVSLVKVEQYVESFFLPFSQFSNLHGN